ncbi:hypothetical protein QTP70_011987 [Hemibagrus guttatus]|uniref:ribonuclease H n=1 Tax=Hemibagrus guttatus TaxID=175788 RepID=A0AAE0UW73_9TELE|nr:hypothetical protein QTP70_011987 [Hemibagrus guttatus]KAK3552374.1 hypothetical protein QTP86_011274 [Hemibagrus guttatus]
MHEVLRDFLHKFVLVYIDDILIYSRSMADHQRHVTEVLHRLRTYHLFLKAEKCLFHQPSVQFLGYVIDHSGVRMDEKKVAAVRDWPTPTSVKELQRFLGFANFYRRFIRLQFHHQSAHKPPPKQTQSTHLDPGRHTSFRHAQAGIYHRSPPSSSRSRTPLRRRGRRLNHQSGSGPVTAAGEPMKTSSMCLLFA